MSKKPILVVDDEPDLIELVTYNLSQEGFYVISERDGKEGLEAARKKKPILIILDLMLPSMDGLEVCRHLRNDNSTKTIPIIMLTAKGSETDKVVGLELGADDYVTKPFSPRELVARVKSVLRRGEISIDAKKVIEHGFLKIDSDMYQASYNNKPLVLTVTEFEILRYLASNPNHVYTRDEVIDGALGKEVVVTDRNIDVHIGAIRKKLGDGKSHIETVRGVGYRFVSDIPIE